MTLSSRSRLVRFAYSFNRAVPATTTLCAFIWRLLFVALGWACVFLWLIAMFTAMYMQLLENGWWSVTRDALWAVAAAVALAAVIISIASLQERYCSVIHFDDWVSR